MRKMQEPIEFFFQDELLAKEKVPNSDLLQQHELYIKISKFVNVKQWKVPFL